MQLTIPPDMGHLQGLRRVLEGWAAAHNVAAETLNLVATELVANAIAVSPRDEVIELSLELDDEAVTLTVSDGGPGGLEPAELQPAGPFSLRGRGLHIVSSLSNRLTVDRVDGRTVVTVHQYRRMLGPLPDQRTAGSACGDGTGGGDGAVSMGRDRNGGDVTTRIENGRERRPDADRRG